MVAISARALFDLEEGHRLFESEGVEAYAEYQRGLENERLAPGIAFPLVRKLLALNTLVRAHAPRAVQAGQIRSEEHTSELQSLMRISYAVFCLKKTNPHTTHTEYPDCTITSQQHAKTTKN